MITSGIPASVRYAGVMEAYLLDWLNLLPPSGARAIAEGVGGEAWEIHGGGFYRVEKYRVAPPTLPSPLHWFKWEAYTTWLSGFGLLVVLYYANASTYLVDRAVADISPVLAVAVSVGLLVVSWFVYDGLSRMLEGHDRWLAAAICALIALTAFGTSHL